MDPLNVDTDRARLSERVQRALEGLRGTGRQHPVALVVVDLHRGDVGATPATADPPEMAEILGRVEAVVRPGDTVARLGEDRLVVMCERLEHPDDAYVIADRLDVALVAGVHGGADGRGATAPSIAVALLDATTPGPDELLGGVEASGPVTATDGSGCWVDFDDGLRTRARERQHLRTALRSALDADELELHYQPVHELSSGAISGVEALLRWRHGGSLIGPDEFVPIAEQTGLIVPIGRWALETATAQVGAWQRLPGHDRLDVAVNVSATQLAHRDLVTAVEAIADGAVLTPGTLTLELTESVLLVDVNTARRRLEELRALGARLALDDFGTGSSSLTYLRRFPVEVVKLDRSFVEGVPHEPEDTAILRAVVELAAALGKDCVAEGIETEEQLVALGRMGCRWGQGNLFSEPLPADGLERLLRGQVVDPG